MSVPNDPSTVLDRLEAADELLVQQVFRPVANEYRISIPAPGSTEEGEPLLFVKQKKLKIKEDIRFRLTPDGEEHLFMIKARSMLEVRGRYDVTDAAGGSLGSLEKSFGKSLLRSHWVVRDTAGTELFTAQESSLLIALVRRFVGMIPVVGSYAFFLQWLPFDFTLDRAGTHLGNYRRVLGKLRDRYVLHLTEASEGVDRRLLVAFTVALDALQDR
ncbi:MAG: hypothetical protein U0R50_08055 [Gaiellales bacterium]